MDPMYAVHLIESGKQVGASLDTLENGVKYANSIGVQKWQGKFRVSVCRIAYDNIAADYFEIDEVVEFSDLNEAFDYLTRESKVPIEQLDVCKGQKEFNPEYLRSAGRLRDFLDPSTKE